jgi:hypothetical protein
MSGIRATRYHWAYLQNLGPKDNYVATKRVANSVKYLVPNRNGGDIFGCFVLGLTDSDRIRKAVGADEIINDKDDKDGSYILFYGADAQFRAEEAVRLFREFPLGASFLSTLSFSSLKHSLEHVGFEIRDEAHEVHPPVDFANLYINNRLFGSISTVSGDTCLCLIRDPSIDDDDVVYPPKTEN